MPWTEPPKNPQGLVLYDTFRIGRPIGSGAQAVVHAIVDKKTGRESPDFVVKLAKTANPSLGKKKYAEANVNASTLNGERVRYRFQFQEGGIVPRLPDLAQKQGNKVFEGTTSGWEYMIIEKMDKPFWSLVDEVIADSGNAKQVDLSLLAQQLFVLAQSVHSKKHMITDVKPDNFMFAQRKKKSQTHADLLRLVDLGLWKTIHKEDANKKMASLTGNAMYCSLKMQQMDHPGRGDDLQMMTLVLAEMAIRVHAKLHDETDKYESTSIPSYLPWSQCKSEKAVFECKERMLLDRKSEFYRRMPSSCADAIYQLIQMTNDIPFLKKPDYEAILAELESFVIPKPAKRKAAASAKRAPKAARSSAKKSTPEEKPAARATRASTRRSRSYPTDDEEEEEDSKPSPRKRRTPSRNNVIDLIDSDDDDSVEPMEVEPLDANGVVTEEGQENMGNRQSNESSNRAAKKKAASEQTMTFKQSLRVTIKRGSEVLHSFDAYPEESFVLTSSASSNSRSSKTRFTIPDGETNHCSVKVVGVKPKPGTREFDKILAVEVQHTAKSGSTVFGSITLNASNKKKSLAHNQIYKGRVGKESKIKIGGVEVTFEKLY